MILPALFFDLDGTLAETEQLHWRSWRAAVAPIGMELDWPTYERLAVGVPDVAIARILSEHFQIPLQNEDSERVLDAKKRAFALGLEHQVLLPQSNIALLRSLSAYPKALVTMSTASEARAILRGAGVLEEFRALVFFEDVERPKPGPEPYQVAMRRLGVESGWAFEDSSRGVASASAAGLEVVRVSSPGDLAGLVEGKLFLR
jgi:HAD superfamily hydrolase (TIGR01509 family)